MTTMTTVHVWTDGGQHGRNPGPGAGAAVLTYGDYVRVVCTPIGECTNNVAETWGVITAISALKKPCNVIIYSDSQYVYFGVRKVLKGRTLETNVSHWNTLAQVLKQGGHSVTVVHTKGHADDVFNNLADAWAGYCAKTQQHIDLVYNSRGEALEAAPSNSRKLKNAARDKAYKQRRG